MHYFSHYSMKTGKGNKKIGNTWWKVMKIGGSW